jgi:ribose 5-phosphate isomerase RpiB
MTFNQKMVFALICWPILVATMTQEQTTFRVLGMGATIFLIAVVSDILDHWLRKRQ